MPYFKDMNLPTFRTKIRNNEHGSSTMSEMAIYLECPDLRPLTFNHGLFIDRFLFPEGDLNSPDERLLERWQNEREIVFPDLIFARNSVVTAKAFRQSYDDLIDAYYTAMERRGEQAVKHTTQEPQPIVQLQTATVLKPKL
jgi:hypothetical protein